MALLSSTPFSFVARRCLPSITKCFSTKTQTPPIITVTMGDEDRLETPISLPTYALPDEGGIGCALPKAQYGGRHTVAMILGDGVSPEMMKHVKAVLKNPLDAHIDFDEVIINKTSDKGALRDAILAVRRNGVALKGSLDTLKDEKSKNLAMRNQLGLFAYVQRCYSFPGIVTRHKNVDFTVIRENTEGEYSQLEHEAVPGVVESMKIITREKSLKIAKFAFDYAVRYGHKKVTAVHKANIMKLGDGLFLNTCENVSKFYPQIEFNSMIIDNCCMQLVIRPQQFDLILLPNLYGNIVGALGAGLVGGAGLAAGMNLGDQYAVFETGTRKSAHKLMGQNIANPCAMFLATANMLDHLGLFDKAAILRAGIVHAISKQNVRTPDMGGTVTTQDMVNAISKGIVAEMQRLST